MSKASYIVAKYISDVFRNEPKNVGIIAWVEGAMKARFLGEKREGVVEGRSIRSTIDDVHTYKQWVLAWRKLLHKDALKLRSTNAIVRPSSEEFLDALVESGKGNFVLERGGDLLEDVEHRDLPEIVEFLFTRLVAEPPLPDEYVSAEEVRDDLLMQADVVNDVRVKLDKRIPVKFGEKTVHHEFHFTIGNGVIEAVGQVVRLSAAPRDVKKTADALAYRFSNVRQSEIVNPNAKRMVLLYSPADEEPSDETVKESIIELEHVAEDVIDLNEHKEEAVERIAKMVRSVKLHDKGKENSKEA